MAFPLPQRCCLAALALLSIGAAPDAAMQVHVGGRAIVGEDGSRLFGWPGVYVEGAFTGTSIRLRMDAPADHLRLLIDGIEKARFSAAGQVDATIAGLKPGRHVARLEKLTESQQGGTRFIGFDAGDGGRAESPVMRARQIEFIGDSFTVGYGNTAPGEDCTPQQVHDTTDTQQAFGPIVARRFDADYRINAYSRFGVVRNYGGSKPESSLPGIYPRLKPDDPARLERPGGGWRPAVIVINLGTNDFSTPLKPGERWADGKALRAAYRARYASFVRDLAKAHPQARFILMASDRFLPDVAEVNQALNRTMPGRVVTLPFSGLALNGCHGHPSLADHRLMADLVTRSIGELEIGWRG